MRFQLLTATLLLCTTFGTAVSAQEGGPPRLSTNPAKHVIFPAKGQTPEQQATDELAAYITGPDYPNWGNPTPADNTIAIPADAVASGEAATSHLR